MNTKSKLKAISIGLIAAIMMVSLLAAVTTVSATDITDCWIGDDNKVYSTIYSGVKAGGYLCLNIDGAYEERKKFSLNAEETTTLSFGGYSWNGVDEVEVCVDCVDTNCCTPEDITPLPDLIVSDKWEESVNEQVIVHFIIENIGEADAESSTACLEINGIDEGTVSVPAIAAGMSHVGAFAAEPCPPLTTIAVTVCADNGYVVEESDEDNNCMTNGFTCPAKPDLKVIAMSETFNVDGQVIVDFVIQNVGDAVAGESFATLYIDNMAVEKQNVLVEELGPNGRFVSEFVAEDCTPDTTIMVRVCADDTHVVEESDESNNCMTKSFTCPEDKKPDLKVVEMSVEPVKTDGQVIVNFIIENVGDAEAGESLATLYIDDMAVEKQNVLVEELGLGGRFVGKFEAEDCTEGATITVRVCADDTHVVEESDESNNCETEDFTCPIEPKPDLKVIEMSETFNVDGQVIVNFIIENVGDAEAGESLATLYIDDMAVEKQNVLVEELGLGGRFVGKFEAEDCTEGATITVRVCADDTHVVEESDESNNCETEDFTCPIEPKPDLKVMQMSMEPVGVDGQVLVRFVVMNIGAAYAGSTTACLEINSVMIDVANVEGLLPGQSYGGAFAAQDCPPLTSILVTVCVDNDDVVEESDESNNCLQDTYTCPLEPEPDLVVSDKYESFDEDGKVIVHFEIHNIGTASAGESYATKYMYIGGVLEEKHNAFVPVIAPNGKFNGAFEPENCPAGVNITVKVCADDTKVVDESNETNNCMTNNFSCPPVLQPDLVVIEKWEEQEYICCGLWQVIVHFVVQNIGEGDAGPSIACKKIDGTLKDTASVPELAAGKTYASAFDPEPCPLGETINFTVCADNYNDVNESNETNNCMTNNCTCPPKPDLVVIEMSEEAVKADGHVIVHYIIENIGEGCAGESYATLYIDDMLVETQNDLVEELGPNGRFTGAFTLEPCPTDKTIAVKVCADDTKVVNESDETNNCMTNQFICPPQGPDLVIEKTVVTTRVGPAVCDYQVDYTVTNNGNETADWCCGHNNSVALFVNGNLELIDDNIPALGPGAWWDGVFNWQSNCLPPNTINLTVCADHYNVVDESNESNNCEINIVECGVAGTITVVKQVIGNANNINIGDIVQFNGRITNDVPCCCCALSDIWINDTLPACLEYVGSNVVPAIVHPKVAGVEQRIEWPKVNTLACGGFLDYTIDARLVDCCNDKPGAVPEGINTMIANATTCKGNAVTDTDKASIFPNRTIKMDITKKVWNSTLGAWADNANVSVGNDVRFRCTIHNDGACRDLTNIQVWDAMELGLVYNSSGNTPYDVTPIDTVPEIYWEFGPVVLEHCEWLNFTVNATVAAVPVGGVYNNTLRVRAWSKRWDGSDEQIFDTRMVNVTVAP